MELSRTVEDMDSTIFIFVKSKIDSDQFSTSSLFFLQKYNSNQIKIILKNYVSLTISNKSFFVFDK